MDELLSQIDAAAETVVDNVTDEDIAAYSYLRERWRLVGGRAAQEPLFRFVYKHFFVLRRFLSEQFLDAYFRRLQALAESGAEVDERSVRKIAEDLRRECGGACQMSFASKMVHMLNTAAPIVDGNVRLALRPLGLREDEDVLRAVKAISTGQGLPRARQLLRNKVGAHQNLISEVKIVDYLLWSYGALRKSGAV